MAEAFWSTKRVMAEPQAREIKDGSMGGHYETLGGYKLTYPDGYESWCPNEVFGRDYHAESGGMTFGQALEAMERGSICKRASRPDELVRAAGGTLFTAYDLRFDDPDDDTPLSWASRRELFPAEAYLFAKDWMVVDA